jgi:uncharacterized protein (DUF433 family)
MRYSTGWDPHMTQPNRGKRAVDISKLFAEGTEIDRALREGVADAIRDHKRKGRPIVVWSWLENRVVWIPADQIPDPDDDDERDAAEIVAPGAQAPPFERITCDPRVMGGRPCIRGFRVTVSLIVNLVANGMTVAEIRREYPELEPEDIPQAVRYAGAANADKG